MAFAAYRCYNIAFLWLFLVSFIRGQSLPVPVPIPSLLDITVDQISGLLRDGSLTSVELVDTYVARIAEVNGKLHAVNEINPDAWHIARELDLERSRGRVRGPLHGIPILLKDNIATRDAMNNTAGSVCLLGAEVVEEATIVQRLRRAGAIILGKSNLSEWAGSRSSFNSTSLGWSGYGGQTRGGYREDQDPGGSSSGSGVSVSLGLVAAALGTETRGSIINPAEWNNIVGIKPTLGLVSRHMVIPITPRQDVVGPMARTVRDAAYVLTAIAGKDPLDNYTMAQPFSTPPDYTQALRLDSLQGARIGVPWNGIRADLYPAQSPRHMKIIMEAFNHSLALLKSAGAIIVDTHFDSSLENFGDIMPWHADYVSVYQNADFGPSLNKYLSKLDPDSTQIRNFEDVIDCTRREPREEYPARDDILWKEAKESKVDPSSAEVWQAYQRIYRQYGTDGIFRTLRRGNLDALVLPSFLSFFVPAYAGSPVVTVPMGTFDQNASTKWRYPDNPRLRSVMAGPGMTFGISFLGHKWSEEKLIGFAYAYEQRTMIRMKVKPLIVPTAELQGGSQNHLVVQNDQEHLDL